MGQGPRGAGCLRDGQGLTGELAAARRSVHDRVHVTGKGQGQRSLVWLEGRVAEQLADDRAGILVAVLGNQGAREEQAAARHEAPAAAGAAELPDGVCGRAALESALGLVEVIRVHRPRLYPSES